MCGIKKEKVYVHDQIMSDRYIWQKTVLEIEIFVKRLINFVLSFGARLIENILCVKRILNWIGNFLGKQFCVLLFSICKASLKGVLWGVCKNYVH